MSVSRFILVFAKARRIRPWVFGVLLAGILLRPSELPAQTILGGPPPGGAPAGPASAPGAGGAASGSSAPAAAGPAAPAAAGYMAPGSAAPAPGYTGPGVGYTAPAPGYAPVSGYAAPAAMPAAPGYAVGGPGYSAPGGPSAPGSGPASLPPSAATPPPSAPLTATTTSTSPTSPAAPNTGNLAAIASSTLVNNPGLAGNLANIGQQLGISPTEVQTLTSQLQSGTLSNEQMQMLTARFGAMNMSASAVAGYGQALGLSPQQISQVQQALGAATQQAAPNQPGITPAQAQVGQPAAPAYVQVLSTTEQRFQQMSNPYAVAPEPSTQTLVQFGYNLFSSPVSTFAPVGNVPVGDDYVIGPGDTFNLIYWGTVNQDLPLVVDRDGSISVPSVGPIQIGGLKFADAKKTVEGQVNQITGVKTQLTMGQLRTITVYVVGEVSQPGAYTVSALSRVTNALVAAGGIAKTGSLRGVQLRRGNQIIERIDLYDVLLHGDNSADERLQQDDVIFVPVLGDVVAVAGDVKRPAIYEFTRADQDLGQVLKLAGGITAFSYTDRLQVDRVENHQRMLALDEKLNRLSGRRFQIRDGDVVKIYPVLGPQRNVIVLAGNVRRPDNYQWFKGMRVATLLKLGEGVLPHTYFKYALVKRMSGPQKYVRYFQVDLGRALAGGIRNPDNLPLLPLDELDIYSEDALRELPHVTVAGEVRAPGPYPLNENMRVSDLIYLGNGFKEDAYKPRAELNRLEAKDGKAVHRFIDVDLNLAMSASHTSSDPVLKTNDQLYVSPIVGWNQPQRNVIASGEFINPGSFTYYDGMRLSNLLAMAGGLKDDAYRRQAELVRTKVLPPDSRTVRVRMMINLNRLISGDPESDIPLDFNDQLFVTVAPDWHLSWVTTVNGRVSRPGSYPIGPNDTLVTLLQRCGGLLPDAYPKGAVFVRAAVQQSEQQSFNQARQQLSAELAQLTTMAAAMPTTGSAGSSGSQGIQASVATLEQVLAGSQGIQADGRIVVHLDTLKLGAQEDFQLQDGDNLTVPTRPASVNVMGQVYNPTSIAALKSLTVADYLYRAGGATPQGDLDNLLVIKADGSVLTDYGIKHTGKGLLFPLLPAVGGGLMRTHLDPGDTIYVPVTLVNLQSVIRWQFASQITSVFANTAQALGIVGLLAIKG